MIIPYLRRSSARGLTSLAVVCFVLLAACDREPKASSHGPPVFASDSTTGLASVESFDLYLVKR